MKRNIILVVTLAVTLTACTSPVERQVEQQTAVAQQSLTLRVMDLIAEGKL